MKLIVKFNLVFLLIFALGLTIAAWVSRDLLERNARDEVLQNARFMMESALASRTYTSTQVGPLLATQMKYEFRPQSVPAYAATEQLNDVRKKFADYSYKEATLNPTNPRDRTVDWEADVVNAFRNDLKLPEIIGERDAPLGRALYLARPIKITDPGCLSCHTTPEATPVSVVKRYGPNGGYGWKMNEIIGAQIVSVPMAVPMSMANQAHRTMIGSLVAVFVLLMVLLNVLLWFTFLRPVRRLSRMADAVSMGNLDVEEVRVRGSDEVAALAGSFNRMRISLVKALKMLEEE